MSNIVPAFSTRQFTLTAAQAIAAWSQGAFKVTQINGFVNAPSSANELVDRTAGSLQYQSAAFASGAVIEVDAYGGLPVYVEQGTAASVKESRAQGGINEASTALNATGALTAAMILGQRVTSTSAAATDMTLPTGAVLAAASTWGVGEYIDWSVTNTGPSLVQLLAADSHTIVGGAGAAIAVPTLTSVSLRTTQVSAGVFVTQTIARAIS
jgi:hypothetical protein